MEIEREPAKEGGKEEKKKKETENKRVGSPLYLTALRSGERPRPHPLSRGVSTKSFAGSNAFFTWRIRHAPTPGLNEIIPRKCISSARLGGD